MSRKSESREPIDCPTCGAHLVLVITMDSFGPANNEHQEENCPKCGGKIRGRKCFSLAVEAGPAEILA